MFIKIIKIIEEIWTFIMMIIKFPFKIICIIKRDHNWKWHSGGFLFDYKYSFTCSRCGLRCTGDMDEIDKHNFKETAIIK